MTEDHKTYLDHFVRKLHGFENLERKTILFPIMKKVREESYRSDKVVSSMGEDAAGIVFDEKEENLVLLTTDAITEEFSKKSPWAAGFSSILVGIDDIYACGGIPTAASVIISSNDAKIRDELMQGILEATHRFEVPLVRGHTSDNTSNVGVSATVIGKIKKDHYISAGGAQIGDDIVIIADFEGKVGESSKYYWNTVTYKSKDVVLKKRHIMPFLAREKVLTASKDVSNGGIIGTLLLLLQFSKKGAKIELEKIQSPKGVITTDFTLVDFVRMYLTSAFLVTLPSSKLQQVKELGLKFGLKVFKIGEIVETPKIFFEYKSSVQEFMDLSQFL